MSLPLLAGRPISGELTVQNLKNVNQDKERVSTETMRSVDLISSPTHQCKTCWSMKLSMTDWSSESICSNCSPIPPRCLSLQAVRLVASIFDEYPGKRNLTSTFEPELVGFIVRIPSPLLLMFSVTAVAMVFSHLYVMGILRMTRELVRRSKLLGKR